MAGKSPNRSRSSGHTSSSHRSSSSSSASASASRSKDRKGRRKRTSSDPTGLKKYVQKKSFVKEITKSHVDLLKRQQMKAVSAARPRSRPSSSPRHRGPPLIFQLDGPQKIRVKRAVGIRADELLLHTTLDIYEQGMSQQQLALALDSLRPVAEETTWCQGVQNPMEDIKQTLYCSRRMVRLVRDVFVNKAYLNREWEIEDMRGVEAGFSTSINCEVTENTGMTADSTSRNAADGYENNIGLLFEFNKDPEQPLNYDLLTSCPSQLRLRGDCPNQEKRISLSESVHADASTLLFVQNTDLHPELKIADNVYVEEIREYLFDPEADDEPVTFLGTTYDSTARDGQFNRQESGFMSRMPGLDQSTGSNSYGSRKEDSRMSTTVEEMQYHTPGFIESAGHITPSLGVDKTIAYMALSRAGRRNGPPRLVLDSPVEKREKSPAPNTAISLGLLEKRRINREISMDRSQSQPRTTMDVARKDPGFITHKHVMTMIVDIGGEVCEFIGNISYGGPSNAEFVPKHVLIDGKLLWQQSSDWNPTSINLTPNENQQSDK